MTEPTQITFRRMSASESLRKLVDEKIDKITARFPDANDFHVVVDCGTLVKRSKETTCMVRVAVTLARAPGRIETHVTHESAHRGVREAFQHLTRQIEQRIACEVRPASTSPAQT